jgi:hypothetical protein
VSPTGSNSNNGTSPSTPWQTIAHVEAQTFSAGDSILFEGAQTFAGGLSLGTSNYSGTPPTSGSPLTVGSYSVGNATILGVGSDGVLLTDIGNIIVENLILTGDGSANFNGVNVTVTTGAVSHVTISGIAASGFGRCGVLLVTPNTANSLSDVTIQNCAIANCTSHITITDNLTAGILSGISSSIGKVGANGGSYVSTLALANVVVSGCSVTNCPGDASSPSLAQSSTGVLLCNTNGGTVTGCYIADNGANEAQGNSGIETNWCSDITVSFNEVYNIISSNAPGDGDGIDFDVGSQNCVAEYNYVHHCGGTGLAMFNFGSFTNSGNIFRYNILENNIQSHGYPHSEITILSFSSGTAPSGIAVYNNTAYNDIHASGDAYMVIMDTAAGGGTGNVSGHFCNNILYNGNAGSTAQFTFAQVSSLTVNGNDYFAAGSKNWDWNGTSYSTLAAFKSGASQEANGLSVDPKLVKAGSGGVVGGYGAPQPTAYQLLPGSALIGAGLDLSSVYSINPGPQDFYGAAIPVASRFNIGAYGGLGFSASGFFKMRLGFGTWVV